MVSRLKHNLALKLDLIGLSASVICAIHCALMTVILIFLPLVGLEFISNPFFEYSFVLISIIIGIFTFKHGYLNHHGRLYPFAIFITGLIIIFSTHFLFGEHNHNSDIHETDIFLTDKFLWFTAPLGAVLIGTSHFINRKLSKTCKIKKCNCWINRNLISNYRILIFYTSFL